MEVKSEPKFDVIQVTDIDIAFPGDLQTFTLRDGVDSYTLMDDDSGTMVMRLAGGTLKFQLTLAHWWAIRHRSIRVPVKPEAPTVTE